MNIQQNVNIEEARFTMEPELHVGFGFYAAEVNAKINGNWYHIKLYKNEGEEWQVADHIQLIQRTFND